MARDDLLDLVAAAASGPNSPRRRFELLIGTANRTSHGRLPHCAVGASDRDWSPVLLACSLEHTRTRQCRHRHPRSPRVNPSQSAIARFLAWAFSWPIAIGIVVWWWWLEADRPV